MEQLRDARPLKILRLREVRSRTGRSTSSIYQGMAEGNFPRSVPLGGAARGWLETEIDDWILARVAERDEAATSWASIKSSPCLTASTTAHHSSHSWRRCD